MVTCAILARKKELQHAARIAGRSNVLENMDLTAVTPAQNLKIIACKNCTCNHSFRQLVCDGDIYSLGLT